VRSAGGHPRRAWSTGPSHDRREFDLDRKRCAECLRTAGLEAVLPRGPRENAANEARGLPKGTGARGALSARILFQDCRSNISTRAGMTRFGVCASTADGLTNCRANDDALRDGAG